MTEVLLITGMAGAGVTTVLKTLEDLGWETVDSVPLSLLIRVVALPPDSGETPRPLAFGFGTRTRNFDPAAVLRRFEQLREEPGVEVGMLFLDCSEGELARRFAETRRRHPLADDRPAADGIALERRLLEPLRARANRLIDTTRLTSNQLAQEIRRTFRRDGTIGTTLTVESFGFARGVPAGVDLVFVATGLLHDFPEQPARANRRTLDDLAHYLARWSDDPRFTTLQRLTIVGHASYTS